MRKRIIAVGHHKNTGKDTFVKFCIDILRPEVRGLRIMKRGFASKLYEFLHSVYGWAGFKDAQYYEQYPDEKEKVLPAIGKSPRTLLIEVGTPVMRAYDNDVWINACLKSQDFDILFITDLRFPNEFEAVEKEGGILIRITRPNLPVPTDVADTALNDWYNRWHMTIENNWDLNSLHKEANKLVRTHILT